MAAPLTQSFILVSESVEPVGPVGCVIARARNSPKVSQEKGLQVIRAQQPMRAATCLMSTLRVLAPRYVAVNASNRAARFRPCIDIHKGKVKQIVGGTFVDLPEGSADSSEARENFVSSQPSSFYARLYAGDSLTGGHIIMLGADDASKQTALQALHAWPGGMQLGGGVNTSNAREWLDAGASHVIVTSFVFAEGNLREDRLKELVDLVGPNRLVLDLSCRKKDGKYYVVTDRWQKFTTLELGAETLERLAKNCDEFLVHGVDVEGLQLGIDSELVELLGRSSPIPVTYAGGARSLDDLDLVKRAGSGNVDVTVGSALDIFGGGLAYENVVRWHVQQQTASV